MKLNLGCWIFYQEGYVNIDRNREVRADRYEDISTLPSFEANCADEIYAGHVAEHVDDVIASFGRWFEVLKPRGRITITVPDCRGANRMWLERKRFPALGVRARRRNHRYHHGSESRRSRRPKKGGRPAQSSLRRIDVANMHGIGGIYQHRTGR